MERRQPQHKEHKIDITPINAIKLLTHLNDDIR